MEVLVSTKSKTFNGMIVDEAAYPLPDLLIRKQPYQNAITNEIRYMDMYEHYQLKFEQDTYKCMVYGQWTGKSDIYEDKHIWKAIPDSPALRLLYGDRSK
jgi:hypothetical protein